MRNRIAKALLAGAALTATLVLAPSALAAPAPAWQVDSLAAPTNFAPGDTDHDYYYEVEFVNVGGAATDGSPITLVDTLPDGLTVKDVNLELRVSEINTDDFGASACTSEASGAVTVTCVVTESIAGALEPARVSPGEQLKLRIHVSVPGGASGSLVNQAEVSGGGADTASGNVENEASAAIAPGGFAEFENSVLGEDGQPMLLAGSHPYQYVTTFSVNTKFAANGKSVVGAGGILKDIDVSLPPGLIGNPTATDRCTVEEFTTVRAVEPESGHNIFLNECPPGSAVGVISLRQFEGFPGTTGPIYNLVPPPGMPAQLGFAPVGAPIYIDTEVRSGSDYGISSHIRNSSAAKRVTAATVMLWGTPADASHDLLRGECADIGGVCHVDGEPKPFLRLPTSCDHQLTFGMGITTWDDPGTPSLASSDLPAPSACEEPPFEPSLTLQPTTTVADSPSGLDVKLHIPQNEDAEELAAADLRDVQVVLPPGLVVNPSSADGLGACGPEQAGLVTAVGQLPAQFDGQPVQCPDASKIGTVEVRTPLLDHPLAGSVYLAQQEQNPFGSLIAIYVAIDDPQSGVVVTLPGKVEADPVTGRLTSTFSDNPQLPFEDFEFKFFSGDRAPLRTPSACGVYPTSATLTPHTAPFSGPPAVSDSSFQLGSGPAGSCPSGELYVKLSAGSAGSTAGAYSPFHLRLTRADGTGELVAVEVETPPGFTAKLAGIPYCPETGISQAIARSNPGDGALEAAAPSCPAASKVGTTVAGVGAGPAPYLQSGPVYLAGPYKGAPLSLVAVIPAIAGPFDLGAVVTRIALSVDPETAQVSAASDPLPKILAGIPLDIREIRVALDRPEFTLNPTNCEPMDVKALVTGVSGQSALATNRFQVGSCGRLGFAPKLRLRLKGGVRRSANPSLRATLTTRSGDANVKGVEVLLPRSQFIDNSHINNPCTRVQFNASACPKSSILGRARAFTPLLDQPLEGPVYFRSNGGERTLPDVVADLHGQIRFTVVIAILQAKGRGLRTKVLNAPDAPVSKFVLRMAGGKRGLLENSENLCRKRQRARFNLSAQNGRHRAYRAVVKTSCKSRK